MKGLILGAILLLLGSGAPPQREMNVYEVRVNGRFGNCRLTETYEVKASSASQAKEIAAYQMEYKLQITTNSPRRIR